MNLENSNYSVNDTFRRPMTDRLSRNIRTSLENSIWKSLWGSLEDTFSHQYSSGPMFLKHFRERSK